MQGRVKRKQALQSTAYPRAVVTDLPRCPLCDRDVPLAQVDAHHLVPKSRGGVQTVNLHRICHRQIHALLTEVELERHYSSIERLKAHPEIVRFVEWVKHKPDDFCERTRKSKRLKSSR
jgi:5-methylcytosine-specific restriction endonuclease McrA